MEAALDETRVLLAEPLLHGVVAEHNGQIVGSNFIDVRSPVAGIGPITVDPAAQNRGLGRRLMQACLDHADSANAIGVRLGHAAYNHRSFALYSRLGFRVREPLAILQGLPRPLQIEGHSVRPAQTTDLSACTLLCRTVHGFSREREVADAIGRAEAMVVEHLGQLTGYATGMGFFSHAVAQTNSDMAALIGAATTFPGLGIVVPARNHDLLLWCFDHGLKLALQALLLTIGVYQEPNGVWLPSSSY